MPQIQVMPAAPSFGSELQKVLAGVGKNIGEGLLKHAEMNKPITKYQEVLEAQRKSESDRKVQTQVGTYLTKLADSGLIPRKGLNDIYAATYQNILSGKNIPESVNDAITAYQEALNANPETSLWQKLFGESEQQAQSAQIPEKTIESNVEAKPKFDISNPEHLKIRDAALKKANGDRKKASKLLEQQFAI